MASLLWTTYLPWVEMEEVVMDNDEVLIIGAGICGLATALALYKKGIKSVVLERSKTLRNNTGAAIGIQQNGWRALDQLGVSDVLRRTTISIQKERIVWLDEGKPEEMLIMKGENRTLKRSDLLDALYAALPPATVKFGCELESIKLDSNTKKPILRFLDGSSIIAKAVIGCDGGRSVVADFLNLKPPKMLSVCAVQGLSSYPHGHSFDHELTRFKKDMRLMGRAPMDDNLVYWFCAQPKGGGVISEDPEAIRRRTLAFLADYPEEVQEMIQITDAKTLSITNVRHRAPWDLLTQTFHKGGVTVVGDAMHVMGPFLGQGGATGLEDAVVLARNLARMGLNRVEEALSLYVKERRMRVVRVSLQAYLIGMLLGSSSNLKRLILSMLLYLLFRNPGGHTDYDCGAL